MIPTEQASDAVLVFLKCGCCGFRAQVRPIGGGARIDQAGMKRSCGIRQGLKCLTTRSLTTAKS
jgi:hypothetical protein